MSRFEPMPRPTCHGEEEPAALACAHASSVECPECSGAGWIEGMEPACCGNLSRSGECWGGCAVPVQTQEQCGFCGGGGEVPMPNPTQTNGENHVP
jgi:hypothetical protein